MKKPIQKVIYRYWQKEVIAILPAQSVNFGNVAIYAHIGQHSEADSRISQAGRLATPEEYAPLHKELTQIYDDCELIIQKRVKHADLLKGWKRTFSDNDFILGMQCGYQLASYFTDIDNPDMSEEYGECPDLAPETEEQFDDDCTKFYTENKALLIESGQHPDQCGHDFWLTRNGHGAGFWDRGLGKIGEKLTAACKLMGDVNLYRGDDGKIYQD